MVKLLDCTLRDGGYINNWEFGYAPILDIVDRLEQTRIDILELGFLKNEPYNRDRTVFNSVDQITALVSHKRPDVNYAAMIEVVNPIPLSMVAERTDHSIDTIRVIVWKTKHDPNGKIVDALEEGYNYCKGIVEKGYNLCVQPARVDQYDDNEFVLMLKKFETLNPMAIYVVDSWGTQNTEQILHYAELADRTMRSEIAIGYHGHNNLMQAFGTASAFIHAGMKRNLIVDASVFGIGRGAGNLNVELFAKYMNELKKGNFKLSPLIDIYEKYIKKIYSSHKWGYSVPYFLTAQYNCNPNYGEYYGMEKGLSSTEIEGIMKIIEGDDKVLFSKARADFYQKKYEEGNEYAGNIKEA